MLSVVVVAGTVGPGLPGSSGKVVSIEDELNGSIGESIPRLTSQAHGVEMANPQRQNGLYLEKWA